MVNWMREGGEYYLGYVEGKPAGTSLLFSLMKTGGIFSVGTLKEYRRRGIATTLTLHAVRRSIEKGNDLHTLQTAKGGAGEQLYKKIGFVTDHTASWYIKKL
jgi:ribosomal protein S18 acetylase RimI-like enzyme